MMYLRYAVWASMAGMFIPVMAVLNARLGRTLGEPLHAAFILFAVGLLATGLASLAFTGRLPSPAALRLVAPINFAGGAIVGFYIFSITLLAPRFGVGNAILFVMTAQIFTSAAIDHFGLFDAAVRPMTALRAGGLALLLAGLWISQLSAQTPAR
ncbi:MAG: DMT family transporter [Lysobacteraceae bacterium]